MAERILVVGKNHDILSSVKDELERAGYLVEESMDALHALQVIEERLPDAVVVTDIMLQDEYGDHFVKETNRLIDQSAHRCGIITINNAPSDWGVLGLRCDSNTQFYDLAKKGYVPDVVLSQPLRPGELIEFIRRLLAPAADTHSH